MRRTVLAAVTAVWAAAAWAQEPSPSWPAAATGGDPMAILGRPSGPALSGSILDARTEDVAGLLRCPVCQGLSVADSPSTMAQNMKREVRELLARGYDDEQVIAYFERSYGEFVRLKPPLRGVNWLLWLAPALALAGGGLVFVRVLRRRGAIAAAEGPQAPPPAPTPVDPALAAYRERVRALVADDLPAAPPAAAEGREKR